MQGKCIAQSLHTPLLSSVFLLQFYEDDLSDLCTVMAFRMLVKDLLVLVQAVNEGVVNLLGTLPFSPITKLRSRLRWLQNTTLKWRRRMQKKRWASTRPSASRTTGSWST